MLPHLRTIPLLACLLLFAAAAVAQPSTGIAAGGLQILEPRFSRPIPIAGEAVDLAVRVQNQGDAPAQNITVDVITPPDVLLDLPEGVMPSALRPGVILRRSWTLTAERPGIYPVQIRVRTEGQPERTLAFSFVVAKAPRKLDTRADRHPHVKADADGNYFFRNQGMVATLLKSEGGFGPLILFPASRPTQPNSIPIGVAPVLAKVTWREGETERTASFIPQDAKVLGDDRLRLRGTVGEGTSALPLEIELGIDDEPWLSWRAELKPTAAARIVRFTPLPLIAGDVGNRQAVLPGVELLQGDEEAPERVPDPYRITVPLMAVAQDRTTVAHLWNPHQKWGGTGYPGVVFDAQNQLGGDRMELFVPAAGQALELAEKQQIRLEGKLLVLRDEPSAHAATRQWVKAFGAPIIEGFPRSLEATRRISREALTKTLWDPEFKGWSPALGENPLPPIQDPLNVALLLMEAGRAGGDMRQALIAQAQSVIDDLRTEGPIDPIVAYRTGGVFTSLNAERLALQPIVDDQLASGAWTWESVFPTSSRDMGPAVGEPGDTELGMVTAKALPLLRYAALTGDSTVAGAGIKALELIDSRFPLPRGAQLVGFPLHANSLLAAAEAAECYLLGYQTSGELRYLDRARYWADAGMPFIYFWGDEQHPAMRYASLASFGIESQDTQFVNVMQWTGLAYARVLRMLSRIRPDGLYDFLSEGILASAIHQQVPEGARAGTYPEVWNVRDNKGEGLSLSPQLILAALYPLDDLNAMVSHARVRVGPDRMFIASGASIFKVTTSAMRARINLKWVEGQDAFTTVIGVPARPISVQYNTSALRSYGIPVSRRFLQEVEDESQPGWNYDQETGTLIVRARHTGGEDHLEIRWPDPKDRTPVDRIDIKASPSR
jgi:hypothetical protein